jgi:hypothetical protein
MARQDYLTMNDSRKIEERAAAVENVPRPKIPIDNCIPATRGCILSSGQELKMQTRSGGGT